MRKSLFSTFLLSGATVLLSTVSEASVSLQEYEDAAEVPNWALTAINQLLNEGIISGTDKGEIKPLETINRAEFTKLLIEATNQTLIDPRPNSFDDVHPEHWFYKYIETAADLGWVTGYNNGDFKPGNPINRAEIAKLINQAFKLEARVKPTDKTWYDAEVRALAANNVLPYNISKFAFGASTTPTRAEVFDQIYRAMPTPSPTRTQTGSNNSSQGSQSAEASFQTPTTFNPLSKEFKAGSLNVSGVKNQTSRLNPNQTNALLGNFNFQASEGTVRLDALQFRRIGNGTINNYEQLWLEMNGQIIANPLKPSNDLVTFNFIDPNTLSSGQKISIQLKGDTASNARAGSSERFVLFLPTWVNANTQRIIGLFPIAGSDLSIR